MATGKSHPKLKLHMPDAPRALASIASVGTVEMNCESRASPLTGVGSVVRTQNNSLYSNAACDARMMSSARCHKETDGTD